MRTSLTLIFIVISSILYAQNYTFNFASTGRRVCLVSSEADISNERIKIKFLDSLSNNSEPLFVYRRLYGSYTWALAASGLPAGTGHWIDTNVNMGETWEYQVKRTGTWSYSGNSYDATGYTIGSLLADNTRYKGQVVLLVADDVSNTLPAKYLRLKKEITADGWFVNELIVPRATSWDSGIEVVNIKSQISALYNNAPANDKPKILFILGHVPLPRCGSTNVAAPDDHNQNKGARGCDAYYADIDGVFTDTATFNPGGLTTPLAINLSGDYKWDQDFIPSDLEMAFGRIDFADLTDYSTNDLVLTENYLDRLSNYKNVAAGYDMGDKSAFYFGYNNSNDGSYRSLPNISKPENVYQNNTGPNHNLWVQNNGPFKIYMQNVTLPEIADWDTYGMNATVYSSDQSYWGFGDVPQAYVYSRIRSLLAANTKCLVALWTTTGINIFHQACTGEALGLSMKTIMNHNATNQYLEKPEQAYDDVRWWNRSHFAFYGDPTLNLYQIAPPTNLAVSLVNGNVVLDWTTSPDPSVIGYHIYESTSENGIYNRITNSVINTNSFTLNNYTLGNWYMVKAVKINQSGCGQFIHGSMGASVEGDVVQSTDLPRQSLLSAYPNPSEGLVYINSAVAISNVKVYSLTGKLIFDINIENTGNCKIDISSLPDGLYMLKISDNKNSWMEKINKITGQK